MEALVIRTDGSFEVVEFTDSTALPVLQQGVGGWVQAIDLSTDLTLWLNEEGKLADLPHNPFAQALWDERFGAYTDYIVGDIVLTGGTGDEGETLGLAKEQVASLVERVGMEVIATSL
jgi:hypothetical protein